MSDDKVENPSRHLRAGRTTRQSELDDAASDYEAEVFYIERRYRGEVRLAYERAHGTYDLELRESSARNARAHALEAQRTRYWDVVQRIEQRWR